MTAETDAPSFTPALFAFLEELADHNDREWFAEHKPRYLADVQEPALAFVEDVGHLLPTISPHFAADARTNGGSLFRIYRDTRFGKDKSPYKTHTGIQFRHEHAKHAHAPCLYLHLEPGNVFVGCGVWRPEAEMLRAIRERISAKPEAWRAAIGAPAFRDRFALGGEALKRAPAGFDPEHPQIEDIRRKSFIAIANLDERTITGRGFLQVFTGLGQDAGPFLRFICDATGMAY